MIGLFVSGSTENGYYEQAMRITRMVLVLVTSMSTVMIPRIGKYFAEGNKERIKHSMYTAYHFAWFLSLPLMFGLLGIADNFIPWFYGPGYEKVNVLLKIVSVITVAISINNVTGIQYLIPTKRERLYTRTVLVGAIANIGLNLILIPRLMSYGAAIASVVAEIIIALVQLIYIRKELDLKVIFSYSGKYLVASVFMFLLLMVEGRYLVANIAATFFMIVTGAAFYCGFLVLLGDSFFIENAKSVLGKILKKFGKKNE